MIEYSQEKRGQSQRNQTIDEATQRQQEGNELGLAGMHSGRIMTIESMSGVKNKNLEVASRQVIKRVRQIN